MPSQSRSSEIAWANSSFERSRSVSSKRSTNWPPDLRAKRQFKMAGRALPHCMRPVGEGAKRTSEVTSALVPEAVDDRIASVATKIAPGDLDAGCRLAAFVLRQVEHVLHAPHQRFRVSALDNVA